ncbi:hypothetical protein DH09_20295 [Bacillaceae bacterium JMAK1]|nr:hypothetical protein DH09_20295 [Bacillaceae bacterium JMAK1]
MTNNSDHHSKKNKTKESFGESIDKAMVGRPEILFQGSCLSRVLTFVVIIVLCIILFYFFTR